MSTRYEDTQESRRSNADDRERGQALRRDVRESGRNIREAGGDIISNWCGLWGNLLASFGEAITPRSRSSRSSDQFEDTDDDLSRTFGCGNGEFQISWGRSSAADRNEIDDAASEKGTRRTSARYTDRDRNIEIEKK